MTRRHIEVALLTTVLLACGSGQTPVHDSNKVLTAGESETDAQQTHQSATSSRGQSCGSGEVDWDEACDGAELADTTCQSLGFDLGELACTARCGFDLSGCTAFVCGDGVRDPGEDCDGTVADATCTSVGRGFSGGTLFCTGGCEYDTSSCGNCGNGTIDGDEDCEVGVPLGDSCSTLGFSVGSLECRADCEFDTSQCTTCGDGIVAGSEECEDGDTTSCSELGFEQGPSLVGCVGCSYDASECSNCGNFVVEGSEVCDDSVRFETCEALGYDGGWLYCAADCLAVVTDQCWTCGNNNLEGDEICDGDLFGGSTDCLSWGQGLSGTVTCTEECSPDFSDCHV